MDRMIPRNLKNELRETIEHRHSLFLFGPRQTGKTTLLNDLSRHFEKRMEYSFLDVSLRQRTEKHPETFRREIELEKPDVVIIDEVQKVPKILDEVQWLIDTHKLVFLITGSSARKLKRKGVNLLAGRAITYRLDPFDLEERGAFTRQPNHPDTLKRILTYGDMPEIALLVEENKINLVENLLRSYVETFLEEEIRQETLIRKVGVFGNFLRLAAEMSGKILSLRELSQDIGVVHPTITSFFTILQDCMIVEKISPLLPSSCRRRLAKASRYLFFDIGVRNAASELLASNGVDNVEWGNRFEQWVGLMLHRYYRSRNLRGKLFYWRDLNGPEVDWVVEINNRWIPVEVKLSSVPQQKHIRHLLTFLKEYGDKASTGYLVYTGERPMKMAENIIALPWSRLYEVFDGV